jgi:hypothetical protein
VRPTRGAWRDYLPGCGPGAGATRTLLRSVHRKNVKNYFFLFFKLIFLIDLQA